MEIINLTPHSVTVAGVKIHQSRTIRPIRILENVTLLYTINTIPIKEIHTRAPENALPESKPHTLYIVSRMVADVCRRDREDLVFPYDYERNATGKILGCNSLARFAS